MSSEDPQRTEDERNDGGPQPWVKALRYSAVGLEFGIGVAVGYWIGHKLDARLGTTPYLMLVGVLVGTAAAFASLVRLTKELQSSSKAGSADEDKETQRPR